MADEPALQQPDLISDPVIAKVTALAPGQRRERSLINSDSATKLLDTIEARYRSVLMAARVIEMAAGPAEKLAEIEMLTALTARRTQEPRHCPVGPDHRDSDPVDQKIGPLSGELIPSFTPPELRRGALHERTDPVQLECVEACPVLDEAIGREVRSVVVTEQSEGSDHRSESTNAGQNLSCPISLTLPVSLRPS